MAQKTVEVEDKKTGFIRGLGLLDSTMLVAGSMIGSGIFLVSTDIANQVGSTGWLLVVWVITGLLTIVGALSYGELAAMMPKAGGVYIYLREAFSPLFGFLYGWTFFLIIQSGGVAAVAVGFAAYTGEIVPQVRSNAWIIPPIDFSRNYAISLSWTQLVAILMIIVLTFINTRGLQLAKLVQNTFTSAKTLALVGLIVICVIGLKPDVVSQNFSNLWTPQGVKPFEPGFDFVPALSAASGAFGMLIALCVAQTGSIFAADGWYYLTFTAGEVKEPRRTIPLSLVFGTVLVIGLYLLANLAYLFTLPFSEIQNLPDGRVATASLNVVLGGVGKVMMAIAIMISTFGANNGIIMGGARLCYTMARDGLFFRPTGRLNKRHVPGMALIFQCVWSCLLVLPRTRSYDEAGAIKLDLGGEPEYGSLYNNLLDYTVFAILIFFVMTILGLFVLRYKRPDADRPYKTWGYPVVPALYILGASAIALVQLLYKPKTTWPGLIIVLTGIPVYFIWRMINKPMKEGESAEPAAD
ncbi:MAG TPA: amino acid permease [Blastocatellia bacterium]|nr:amino acid permease [Blastocatellia bacterium]